MKYKNNYMIEVWRMGGNAISRRMLGKELFPLRMSHKILDSEHGNNKINKLILEGKPFAVTRFGATEIRMIADVLYDGLKKKEKVSAWADKRIDNTGFFPNNYSSIKRFVQLYLDCCEDIDILAVWNIFMQKEIAERFVRNSVYTTMYALEPYYFEHPWSMALKNKKVLVIHPFAQSIQKQYLNRRYLFKNQEVLPEFELHTLKAVQTIAGEESKFANWFEALEWMYNEALNVDFDIALIGCGAYGLPLAVQLKRAGKQTIHIGGALQLLFGIKGNRWENKPEASILFNEYWIRADSSERPKRLDQVEGGCYW